MEEEKIEINVKSLNLLDIKLKDLKREWDFFFSGQRRTPPFKEQEDYDKKIKKYKNTPCTDNALKFKLNSIFSNYISYKELWAKKLKLIEEGKSKITKDKMVKQIEKPREIVISKQSNLKEQIETIYDVFTSLSNNSKPGSYIEFEKKLRQQFLEVFRKTNCGILKISIVKEEGKTKIKVKPIKEK